MVTKKIIKIIAISLCVGLLGQGLNARLDADGKPVVETGVVGVETVILPAPEQVKEEAALVDTPTPTGMTQDASIQTEEPAADAPVDASTQTDGAVDSTSVEEAT